MVKKLKYQNITVTGKICTGSTTLATALAEKLGWKYRNSGQIFREYMVRNKKPLENTTRSPDSIHHELDNYVINQLKKRKEQIFEGWLTGFMARDIPGVLKVLLICDDALRIDRLVNRDNMTVNQAKKHLKKREAENFKKWSKMYRATDFWEPKYYDLVIDTYANSKEETLKKVLRELGYYNCLAENPAFLKQG